VTPEEFETQERRLTDDIESARQTLNNARRNFDRLCEELRVLRTEWRDRDRPS
jgi:hypothetical protein